MTVAVLTFSPGTTIKSADVNSDIAALNNGKLDLTGGTLTGNLNGTNAFLSAILGALGGVSLDHTPWNGESADALLIYGASGGAGVQADIHIKDQTGGWVIFNMASGTGYVDALAQANFTALVVGGNQTLHAISVFSGTGAGTASHGLGRTPAWVGVTDSQTNSTMTVGVDSYGSSTVHINAGASHTWIAVAIG